MITRRSDMLLPAMIFSLALLTACGGDSASTGSSSSSQSSSISSPEAATEFTGTVADLMKTGRDVTCTFNRNEEGATMEGTVYIARDGRMRGDFTMTHPATGEAKMHMIQSGGYGYTWGYPSETKGMKVKTDASDQAANDFEEQTNMDDQMDYRCQSWRIDEVMLQVPSGVTFTDVSAFAEQAADEMNDAAAAGCSACDQLPAGSTRDECRTALGC